MLVCPRHRAPRRPARCDAHQRPGGKPRTMTLTSGSVVFSDQFTSAHSGWPQTTLASGNDSAMAGRRRPLLRRRRGRRFRTTSRRAYYDLAVRRWRSRSPRSVTSGDPATPATASAAIRWPRVSRRMRSSSTPAGRFWSTDIPARPQRRSCLDRGFAPNGRASADARRSPARASSSALPTGGRRSVSCSPSATRSSPTSSTRRRVPAGAGRRARDIDDRCAIVDC